MVTLALVLFGLVAAVLTRRRVHCYRLAQLGAWLRTAAARTVESASSLYHDADRAPYGAQGGLYR